MKDPGQRRENWKDQQEAGKAGDYPEEFLKAELPVQSAIIPKTEFCAINEWREPSGGEDLVGYGDIGS